VSASYDDTIKVWTEEDDDWVCQQTLKAHRSTVWGLAFNRSGDRLVSCSDDRSLMLWRAAAAAGTGVAQWELADTLADAHRRTIFGVSWSRWHGLIASAGADNAVGLFSAAGDKLQRSALVEQAHEADVNCVAWNPSEAAAHLLASAGDDSAVKIWALAQPAK
jgi:WD40 repeat protein